MLMITPLESARDVSPKKPNPACVPTGVCYAVLAIGFGLHEVRRREYRHGECRSDSLVAVFTSEADADHLAWQLAQEARAT